MSTQTGQTGQAAVAVTAPAAAPELPARPPISGAGRAWRRFRRNPQAIVALVITTLLVAMAICAPLISTYVTKQKPERGRLLNAFDPPGPKYWLGADEYGRDVLTRIVYGGRVSLGVAFLGVAVALVVGTLAGAVAGYYGGWVDAVLMRFVDVMLSIPAIFLLILIGAMFQVGPAMLAVIIALLSWFGLARLIRAEILSVKHRDFVDAARVVGVRPWSILFRHILPNVAHIVIVWGTVAVPGFILVEAALSFLGLGVQPPTPSWGNMLTNATQYFYKSIGLVFIPGFFITLTVLSLSVIGDALGSALDPRQSD